MRRILVQVHRWVGIVLGLYVLVIGISGAALVFQEDAAAVSRVPKVTPTSAAWMNPDLVASKIRTEFPDMHLHTLFWPENDSSPWFAEVKKGEIGYFGETAFAVYLHPSTGEILHVHNYGTSIWRMLQVIHINLATGRVGRTLNSYLGLVAFFLVLIGFIIWFPQNSGKAPLWKINWRARPKRLIWEIHQVFGIYSILFFLLLCSTGAYFGWRAQTQKAIAAVFPFGVFNRPMPKVNIPLNAEPKPISSFLASIHQQVPNYPVTRVLFPEQTGQPIRFAVYEGNRRESEKANNLFFNPFTGELLRADLFRNQLIGDRLLLWISLVHFGAFGSVLVKIIWVVGGMMFPLMAITGAIIFVSRLKPQSQE